MTKRVHVYVVAICVLAACSSSAQQALSPSKPPAAPAPASAAPQAAARQMPKSRFAGKHLILLDVKANLIIDFMLNAMQ